MESILKWMFFPIDSANLRQFAASASLSRSRVNWWNDVVYTLYLLPSPVHSHPQEHHALPRRPTTFPVYDDSTNTLHRSLI